MTCPVCGSKNVDSCPDCGVTVHRCTPPLSIKSPAVNEVNRGPMKIPTPEKNPDGTIPLQPGPWFDPETGMGQVTSLESSLAVAELSRKWEINQRFLSFFGLPPGTVCDRCGSPDHISGLGACSKYVMSRCCHYCQRKDIETRENGAYHGCRDCLKEPFQKSLVKTWKEMEGKRISEVKPDTHDIREEDKPHRCDSVVIVFDDGTQVELYNTESMAAIYIEQ